MLNHIDRERQIRSQNTSKTHKGILGQYLTPLPVARFMASLLDFNGFNEVSILDPGSGQGALGIAAIESNMNGSNIKSIHLDSYEIDKTIIETLHKNLESAKQRYNVDYEIIEEDFIQSSVNSFNWNIQKEYSHIIMNPPYKKMPTGSLSHRLLKDIDVNTVNMYSAFVWLALKMVKPDGQVVAIIPRSFCNGTYYKPFREFIIGNVAIEHIHVFESRKEAFSDDSVLQENVVISFRKRSMAASTIISWSMDSSMSDYHEKRVRTEEIIKENDTQKYIHIPIGRAKRHKPDLFSTSFSDLGLSVSTGPIVDFRMKDLLLDDPSGQSVPLMYPVHFRNYKLSWPQKSKKPNAILLSDQVKKNLFHNGNYVLIRRFSSKEERHRVVASILCTDDLENEYFTFENHLNVIHRDREGIDIHLALGLICFLNSDILDTEFRKFSGHTQVNAADIKTIRYPTLKELVKLGIMMEKANEWMQFDLMIKEVING